MTYNILKIFSILSLLMVGSLSVEADYENLEFGLEYEPEPEPVSSEDGVTILDVATEEDSIDSSLVKNIEGSGSGDDAVIVESERANVASEEENYMMMDENVELLSEVFSPNLASTRNETNQRLSLEPTNKELNFANIYNHSPPQSIMSLGLVMSFICLSLF